MASRFAVHIVCSDQPRNGKSLLARVLSDFLLLDGRDPFLIDISHPEGTLRNYFPGRTVLVDFSNIRGQMKAFDTIMQAPGRDYVIDVSSPYLDRFCEAAKNLNLSDAFREVDLAMAVFFVVDAAPDSLKAAAWAEKMLKADIFVPVRNTAVGSALPARFDGMTLNMPRLDPELHAIIENRRFSLRTFLQGDEADVPARLRPRLKDFLQSVMTELRAVAPALSLVRLRSGAA
jgi:hypothetical protein